jgi:hypothetical protein
MTWDVWMIMNGKFRGKGRKQSQLFNVLFPNSLASKEKNIK